MLCLAAADCFLSASNSSQLHIRLLGNNLPHSGREGHMQGMGTRDEGGGSGGRGKWGEGEVGGGGSGGGG